MDTILRRTSEQGGESVEGASCQAKALTSRRSGVTLGEAVGCNVAWDDLPNVDHNGSFFPTNDCNYESI
jgi:hypothetical protein